MSVGRKSPAKVRRCDVVLAETASRLPARVVGSIIESLDAALPAIPSNLPRPDGSRLSVGDAIAMMVPLLSTLWYGDVVGIKSAIQQAIIDGGVFGPDCDSLGIRITNDGFAHRLPRWRKTSASKPMDDRLPQSNDTAIGALPRGIRFVVEAMLPLSNADHWVIFSEIKSALKGRESASADADGDSLQ